jgi:hypothetical protein
VSRQLVSSLPIVSTTSIDYFVYISYVLPLFWIIQFRIVSLFTRPLSKVETRVKAACLTPHPHPQGFNTKLPSLIRNSNGFAFFLRNLKKVSYMMVRPLDTREEPLLVS